MIKAYTITPSETEPNVVEIHDTTPGKVHGAFATAVYQMEDSDAAVDALGRRPFDAQLWERIGPMLAAPVMLAALRRAVDWHYGDPWRESTNTRERTAWKVHASMLQEAVEVATALPPMVQTINTTVTMPDNTPKAPPVTLAYVIKGFFSEVTRLSIDIRPQTEKCGELDFVSEELIPFADLVEEAYHRCGQEFEGCWEYEISEPYGAWLATLGYSTSTGRLERMPTKAEAATMLDLLILKGAAKGAA